MTNNRFLYSKQVKSLTNFNEYYAFVMIAIFSLMPHLALFGPPEFGPLFIGISRLMIYSFVFLGAFQLISYASFSSRRYPLEVTMGACFEKLKTSVKSDISGILLIVTYVLCVISAMLAYTPVVNGEAVSFFDSRMFRGTEFRPDGIFMYTCFFVVYVYSSMIKKDSLKKAIFAINIIGFVLVSLIVVQQYYGVIGSAGVKEPNAFGRYLSYIYEDWGIRYGHYYKGLTGCFYNQNHVAYYMTVGSMLISALLIMSAKAKSKILWSVLAAYSYYAIVINNTFGCYLAVAGSLIITGILIVIKQRERNFKKIANAFSPLAIFLAVTIIFGIINSSNNSITNNFSVFKEDIKDVATSENLSEENAGSGRMSIWMDTIDMIIEKPIFGWGADNLKAEYVARDESLDRAHNEPMEIAVANGMPAALAYYAAIALALFMFIKRKDTFTNITTLAPFMAAVGYLISSMVGVMLFYTAGFFIIMLAFIVTRKAPVPEIDDSAIKNQRKK